MTRPANLDHVQADDPFRVLAGKFPAGTDLSAELLALLATPTIASKRWVWSQYDHQLFLNTVVGPTGDAAVLRIKGTPKAIAISTDGKARFCQLDPSVGAALAVIEAARNVSCTGATPLALVNCLNFGNPEHPEVMWQFSEAVDGMSAACRALDLPVVGGNVSFYNESRGENIHPTPVVGVVGLIDELGSPPPPPALRDGDAVVVLGATAGELGGSEWAAVAHGLGGGRPPVADLDAAVALHALVRRVVRDPRVHGVHDCSDGGLAVCLAEMAIAGGVGFEIDLDAVPSGARLSPAEAAFSESANRVVLSLAADGADEIVAAAADVGVPASVIGVARGDRLVAASALAVGLAPASDAWGNSLARRMA